MPKTILITGSTDGIGLETAKRLAGEGHRVLLHGRSAKKVDAAADAVGGDAARYVADLSRPADVVALANRIAAEHDRIDVLINNAGVFKTPETVTGAGLDVRFAVNTVAPYVLTARLLPILPADGRVVNISSAAQAPVDVAALLGKRRLSDMEAYAQSKLALIVWTRAMAAAHPGGPVFVAVNPGSLLASKMVREGFGTAGNDINIGVDILARAALSDSFADRSGDYFDNDAGRFASPSVRVDERTTSAVMEALAQIAGADLPAAG